MKPDKEKLNLRYILLTRKALLIAVAFVSVSVLMVLAVILPQIRQSYTLWSSWRKELANEDQLKKKVAQLQQVSSDATAEQAALVNQVLPSKKPLLELMSVLGQVAQASEVSFSTVELSPGKIATGSTDTPEVKPKTTKKNDKKTSTRPVTPYETLEVDLTVSGTLANINRFFQQVEQVAPATTITSITLDKAKRNTKTVATSANESSANAEIYEAQIVVETYYFTKSISATLDAPLPLIGTTEEALLVQLATYLKGITLPQDRVEGGGLNDLFGTGADVLITNPLLQSPKPQLPLNPLPDSSQVIQPQ